MDRSALDDGRLALPLQDQPEQPDFLAAQPEYGAQPAQPTYAAHVSAHSRPTRPRGRPPHRVTADPVPPAQPPYGAAQQRRTAPCPTAPSLRTGTHRPAAPRSLRRAPYAPGTPYAPYGQDERSGRSLQLVCGIAGFLFFIPAVLGVIFGFVSRAQIKNSGGRQKGGGMAIAGIVVGFAWLVVLVLIIAFGNHNNNANDVVNPAGFPLQLLLGGHAN